MSDWTDNDETVMTAAGEFIELVDLDDGGAYFDEAHVRGHVSDDEATAALAVFLDEWFDGQDEDYQGNRRPEYGPWKHRYARWATVHGGDGGDPYDEDGRLSLMVYSEPGLGRFPVTIAVNVDLIRSREARKFREE